MKLNVWLLSALAPLTAVSILAQPQTSAQPAAPPPPSAVFEPAPMPPAAPATNAPAKAKHKAKAKKAKPAAAKLIPVTNNFVTFDPPITATVKCAVLEVRGQGSFIGEVITNVKKGETVTVLGEITRSHVHAGEPAKWSRILLPAGTPVWVSAEYVDADTGVVRAKRLNVRGGPGENYSIVNQLDKGETVKFASAERKAVGWLAIEPPTNTVAFVASEYVEKGPELAVATPPPTQPPHAGPPPTVVNVPTDTAPPPTPAKTTEPTPPELSAPAPTPSSQAEQELAALRRATAPEPAVVPPTPTPPAEEKEEVPRIVTREGYVHRALNIQAPTDYELRDIKTGETIEFIQPADSKKFKIFLGTRVHITGAEILDSRWPRTPILQVQTVDLMP